MNTTFKRGLRAALAGSLLCGGSLVALVIGGSLPASATTPASLYVAVGKMGNCTTKAKACGSIQTAITKAEGGTYNGKRVTINVAAGTYTENDIINASSLGSLTIAGASSTTVSGNSGSEAGTVFTVNGGTVTISGLTITNGDGSVGGGIGNETATLNVTHDTITGNTTSGAFPNNGAGIDNGDNGGSGTVTVTDSTITENTTSGDGGAIDNGDNSGTGTFTVTDSTISGNSAGFNGGGIDNADDSGTGTVTVIASTISGNSGGDYGGGGIANGLRGGNGTVTVTDSTFTGNFATAGHGDGGAINNGDDGSGTVTVTDSTFTGNYTTTGLGDGGAIDNADDNGSGTVTVTNSTFSDNTACSCGDGGAIDNGDDGGSGTLIATDSTFSGNSAGLDGGTIDNGDDGGGGSVSVAADIFDGSCSQSGGSWTDNGYNLGTDGSCLNGGTSDVTDSGLTLPGLANNGGPTQTILPPAGPPASGVIPTGTTLNGVSVCPRLDQRGAASQGNCAIGAAEPSMPPFFFFSTTPLPPATPGTAYGPVTLTTDGAASRAKFKWTMVTLPEGLTLSSKGVLSGTPNVSLTAGLSSITVKATEKVGRTKTTVEATIPLTIT